VRFEHTPIAGAYVLQLERQEDERGYFARTFSIEELAARGLETTIVQASVSFNRARHTLRGLHYQAAPHEEIKLVRCTVGAIHDVIVDLRPESPTYRTWHAVVLDADSLDALYIPHGVAHGFLSLTDGATVTYQMSTPYHADSARGVRWNDPALDIPWPAEPQVISQRDATYPLLENRHE
jgi:dTDP-4-dehydrorhamnose 3,5-epimerase